MIKFSPLLRRTPVALTGTWKYPNRVIDASGVEIKGQGSSLPDHVLQRVYDLSYEFMDYPDDVARLGLAYYQRLIDDEC